MNELKRTPTLSVVKKKKALLWLAREKEAAGNTLTGGRVNKKGCMGGPLSKS